MNDQRKTKNQLMQELQRERELVRRERERSIALQEVSSKVAAVHDTDEVLDLIVNEAARLLGADGAIIWLLEGDEAVPRAATETAAEFFASAIRVQKVGEGTGVVAHVLETKKPLYGNAVLQVVTPESISFLRNKAAIQRQALSFHSWLMTGPLALSLLPITPAIAGLLRTMSPY